MECSSTELGYRQNTSYRAKNVVNVLKLVARDTIEEKIIHLQEKKAKLADKEVRRASLGSETDCGGISDTRAHGAYGGGLSCEGTP